MDRRKALLLVAAVIAAVGTLLVFFYVRGADTRADQRYDAVQVLRVVKPIAAGETVEAAQAAGKIESGSVSKKDLLPDALTGTEPIAGKVATDQHLPGRAADRLEVRRHRRDATAWPSPRARSRSRSTSPTPRASPAS